LDVDLAHLLASRDQELQALSADVIICTISSGCDEEPATQIEKKSVIYLFSHAAEQQGPLFSPMQKTQPNKINLSILCSLMQV
jgi:hypothetical protein